MGNAIGWRAWLLACILGAHPTVTMAQAPPDTRAGSVTVAEAVHIHYVEAGDSAAPLTILFVPGWCTSRTIWRDQVKAFASMAHVVAIDPRSQGDSTITTDSNTPERRAEDLYQVIQALKRTNVVLVGWSQGVQDLAAYAAAYRGEGIAGYVLVDATVGAGAGQAVRQPEQLKLQLERLSVYERYPKQYLRGMMEAIIRSPEGRARIDELVAVGLRTPPDLGISMLLMDFIAYDRRATLEAFNRPTLVIASAQSDELEELRLMSGRIKGARFATIEDAGHAVFLDQPRRFNSLLAEFVQQTALTVPR
jgi:non-heme chloroperoxidase